MLRKMKGLQRSQSLKVPLQLQVGPQTRTRLPRAADRRAPVHLRRLAMSRIRPGRLLSLDSHWVILRATTGACLERASRVDSGKRNAVAMRPSVDNVGS